MSDKPKFDGVSLVAVALGFYNGAMVPVGREFKFTGNRLPKWAKDPAEAAAELAKPKRQVSADTKPANAQAAVKAKASAASA